MQANTSAAATQEEEEEEEAGRAAQLAVVYEVTYCYLVPTLISVGVFTNLLNVVMLWRAGRQQRQRQAQATTFSYLLWLAITDMLASLSLVPSIVHFDRTQLSYAWAFYYAHFEIPVQNALTSASVYIVVGLSVDRYVAVCHPRRYQAVSAPNLALIRITLSLLVPVLLYIPHGFSQVVQLNETSWSYTYDAAQMAEPGAWYVWTVVVELCHRMAPATLLVILNFCIIYTFKQVTARRRNITKNKGAVATQASNTSRRSEDDARSQQEQRLVYLLLAIVAAFLLTTLPAAVLALIDTEGPSQGSFSHEVFRAVANCLEVLGFSLNFVLYFIFVPDVRRGLREALMAVVNKTRGLAVQAQAAGGCPDFSTTESRAKDTELVQV